LWKISVRTSPEAEDALTASLTKKFSQPATSYHDRESGAVTVTVFLSENPKWSRVKERELKNEIESVKGCGLDTRPGTVSVAKVRRQDWAESWKRHFKPLEVGPALLIKPTWSQRRARRGQAVVLLDPGLSFGTGQHATTGFCLRQLVKGRDKAKSQSFLDVGTGSGILAIAAAKLGYAPVRGFDFDPQAVKIARANARMNQVSAGIEFFEEDVTQSTHRSSGKYALICANLVCDLLLKAQPHLMARLQDDGVLVLAGILRAEFWRIQEAFEASGLRLVASCAEKEWRSGSFAWK
jgi:ribosomal protein L11 methyltransferase